MSDGPSFPKPGARTSEPTPYRAPAPRVQDEPPARPRAIGADDVEVVLPATRDEIAAIAQVGAMRTPSRWLVLSYIGLPMAPISWLLRTFLPDTLKPVLFVFYLVCFVGIVAHQLRRIW